MQVMKSKTRNEPVEAVSGEVAPQGLEIWKRRMRLNVSCAALAARAAVSEGVLYALERWQKPVETAVLERIEQALATFAAAQGPATSPADEGSADETSLEP